GAGHRAGALGLAGRAVAGMERGGGAGRAGAAGDRGAALLPGLGAAGHHPRPGRRGARSWGSRERGSPGRGSSRRRRGMTAFTTEFTPVQSLLGGGLVGLAAVLLMALHGRIAGMTGILA